MEYNIDGITENGTERLEDGEFVEEEAIDKDDTLKKTGISRDFADFDGETGCRVRIGLRSIVLPEWTKDEDLKPKRRRSKRKYSTEPWNKGRRNY